MKKPEKSASLNLSRSLPHLSNNVCHCPSCCSCRANYRRSWNSPCPLLAFPAAEHPPRPTSMLTSHPTDYSIPAILLSVDKCTSTLNTTNSTDNCMSTLYTAESITDNCSSTLNSTNTSDNCTSTLNTTDSTYNLQAFRGSESTAKRGSQEHDDCPVFSFGRRKRFRRPKGVPTIQFHSHLRTILEWYEQFDDSQKNDLLKQLLERSNSPQTHLLSTLMEPVLHANCPHNCTDILYWLPPPISLKILGYLDYRSLVQCSQINKYWCTLASDEKLWHNFCYGPFYRLSSKIAAKQLDGYQKKYNYIPWKQVFTERHRLHENWLKGNCFVRTFSGHTQGITCVQFDDYRIVSGSSDKTIKVWSTRTNTPWAGLTLRGHSGTVRCLHLNENQLVSGSSDCTIKVWDLAEGVGWSRSRCTVTMVGHSHTVRCLQVGLHVVISGSYDHTVKKWRLDTGDCLATLRGHSAAVLSVQFGSQRIVSGSSDHTIKVWSFDTGECFTTLTGHRNAVTCIHFDSTRIVSGSLDTQIRLWDIKTERCVQTLDWASAEGHTGVVRCLQADCWRIVSAADDKTLKVWSLESGKRLVTLREHTDGVTCLQFNDLKIVSGSYDKTVKLWDFTVNI